MPDSFDRLLGLVGGYDPDPATWTPIYESAAKATGVPIEILRALTAGESSGHVGATSEKGAGGPQQIMPATAAGLGVSDSSNPNQAIPASAKYLMEGYKKYGNWRDALKYYFAGPNQQQWGPKTAQYPGMIANKLIALGYDPKQFGLTPQMVIHPQGAEPFPGIRAPGTPPPDADKALASLMALVPPKSQLGQTPNVGPDGLPATPVAGQPGQRMQEAQLANLLSPNTPTPIGMVGNGLGVTSGQGQFASTKVAPQPTGQVPQQGVPPWNFANSIADAALLGQAPWLLAKGDAVGAFMGGLFGGQGLSRAAQLASQANDQTEQQLTAARQAYNQQNPMTSLVAQVGGSLVPISAGLKLTGAAAQLGGRALGAAAPVLAPALSGAENLLSGTMGLGKGLGPAMGRLGSDLVRGGTQGALAGAIQSPLADQPAEDSIGSGAALGAALGPVIGPIGRGLSRMFMPPVAPGVADIAGTQTARDLAIRPGQIAQGEALKTLDRLLHSHSSQEQLELFSGLTSKLMGGKAEPLTSQNFAQLRDNIADGLDAIAKRTGVTVDNAYLDDLTNIRKELNSFTIVDTKQKKQALALLDKMDQDALVAMMGPGKFTGEQYQQMTRFRGDISKLGQSPDSQLAQVGRAMRRSLDDALERTATPEDVGLLRDLRNKWFIGKTIEPLVEKAQPSGIIDPKALQGALAKARSDYAWSRPSPIKELAQLGRLLPSPTAVGDLSGGLSPAQVAHHVTRYGPLLLPFGVGAAAGPTAGLVTAGAIPLALAARGVARNITGSDRYTNALLERAANGGVPQITIRNPLVPTLNQMYLPNNDFNQGAPR